MNIILLSGGGGERLWPLSGQVKSKQFLKLLRAPDGSYESMLQRIIRQIRGASAQVSSITVASGKQQEELILDQVGEDVAICIEPERRNTFPAILYAVTYLHDFMGHGEDEYVAVCPADHYVSKEYYDTICNLDRKVDLSRANLTLLGIEANEPSEKYGYIIPECRDRVSSVREFKEKPHREKAQEYLSKGAMWNAGVFVFQLGYLLDKAEELLGFSDYESIKNNYSKLPRTSFDYQVSEKEQKIQVVRYTGEWLDLGAWDTLTEIIPENILGNALLDEACENTHVINELEIPVLCMGCKNLAVVVTERGILVTEKNRSSQIKPYVEKLMDK